MNRPSNSGPARQALAQRWPARRWPALMLAAWLNGCGPGVGGTGTGESAPELALFGASTASLCAAPFAASLACVAGGTSSAVGGTILPGTAPLRYIDAAQGAQVVVEIEDHSVRLTAPCQRLGFIGDWGTTASGEARFFGSSLVDGAVKRQPASLSVATAQSPGELIAWLRDAEGQTLLGPLTLQRAPQALPPAAPCPG